LAVFKRFFQRAIERESGLRGPGGPGGIDRRRACV